MKRSLVLIIVALAINVSYSQDKSIQEIHSTMLYNFMKYIHWPNEGDGSDFTIGVLGEDEVFKILESRYAGKPKGTGKYVIKKLTTIADATKCNVVYLGKGMNGEFSQLKTSIEGKPILTITDGQNLGTQGSCINFTNVDGRLRFEMNEPSFNKANLKVSNQLLSMAIRI